MRRTILVHGGLLLLLATACGGRGNDQAGTPTTNGPPATSSSPVSSSASDTARISDPSTTPPTTAACTVGDLKISLGESEGVAGTTYRALVFTNTGSEPCAIEGIPRVSFVAGDDRHRVGAAATPVGAADPAVMLTPEAAATAPVGFVNIGNFDPEVCQPTEVRGLRVYPPGGQDHEFIPFDTTACGADNFRNMTVQTVHLGTGLVREHA